MNGQQLYLKPDEAKFLAMAVVSMIEQLTDSSKDETLNWNPETRKTLKEMITAGRNLKVKMAGIGINMSPLPDYNPGDEDEFLTKQS